MSSGLFTALYASASDLVDDALFNNDVITVLEEADNNDDEPEEEDIDTPLGVKPEAVAWLPLLGAMLLLPLEVEDVFLGVLFVIISNGTLEIPICDR